MSKKIFFWNGNKQKTCEQFKESMPNELGGAVSFTEVEFLPELGDAEIDDLLYVFDAGADKQYPAMMKLCIQTDLPNIRKERPDMNLCVVILNAKTEDRWPDFFKELQGHLHPSLKGKFHQCIFPVGASYGAPEDQRPTSDQLANWERCKELRSLLSDTEPPSSQHAAPVVKGQMHAGLKELALINGEPKVGQPSCPDRRSIHNTGTGREQNVSGEGTPPPDTSRKMNHAYDAIKALCENKGFWKGKVFGGSSLPKGMARIYKITQQADNYCGSYGLKEMAKIAQERLNVVPRLFEPSTWFKGIRAQETREIYETISKLSDPAANHILVCQKLNAIQNVGLKNPQTQGSVNPTSIG